MTVAIVPVPRGGFQRGGSGSESQDAYYWTIARCGFDTRQRQLIRRYRLSLVTASVCIAPGELTDSIPALHSLCSCSSKALLAPRRIRFDIPGVIFGTPKALRSCAKVEI